MALAVGTASKLKKNQSKQQSILDNVPNASSCIALLRSQKFKTVFKGWIRLE